MPPKPRMISRKALQQNADLEQAKTVVSASSKMLPPPSPKVSHVILQPELNALEASYKDIAITTGKLFQFYSHSRKERIATYSPYPPASIARMLGRSLERYDQICDIIETRLQHSIAVIQRDIKALKARSEAEAEELARKRIPPSTTPALLASPIDQPSMFMDTTLGNVLPPSSSMQNRRQSAILSSLHRPGPPLKLDLSSLSFHTDQSFATPVDVSVDLGLTRAPSPVTLAPKTAKTLANDPTLELFINPPHQGISDLSMDNENHAFNTSSKLAAQVSDKDVIDLTSESRGQLGDSADKPIELDMETSYDDMDLFGDRPSTPRNIVSDETVRQNEPVNNIPLSQNLDENLNKLLMGAGSIKDPSMSLHEEPPSSHEGNDSSTDTFRPLEDNRRFNLANVDFSALTGLFNAGNGTSIPQSNAPSDLDLMSQLLGMGGGNQTN